MVIKQDKTYLEAVAATCVFSGSFVLSIAILAIKHSDWLFVFIVCAFNILNLTYTILTRKNKLVVPNAEDVLETGVIYERVESGCLWVPYQTNRSVDDKHDYISYVQIRHPRIDNFILCAFEDLVPKRFMIVKKNVYNDGNYKFSKVTVIVPVSDEEFQELRGIDSRMTAFLKGQPLVKIAQPESKEVTT